jgi:cytoskeleton-associated protein 5
MEPKDLSKVVTGKWFARLSEKKWSDRRDALDLLIKECADPRIHPAPDGFVELAKYLKKVVSKDTNVVVVSRAAEVSFVVFFSLSCDFLSLSCFPILMLVCVCVCVCE